MKPFQYLLMMLWLSVIAGALLGIADNTKELVKQKQAPCPCCQECCDLGHFEPLHPDEFDELAEASKAFPGKPVLHQEPNGTWTAWVFESENSARLIGCLPATECCEK